MKIKVCGMRDPQNVAELLELQPDFMGMIFYPKSSRFVTEPEKIAPLVHKTSTKLVGVFVNEPMESIEQKIKDLQLDYVQLHGNETVEYAQQVKALGVGIIRAISVANAEDFDAISREYERLADYLLFDYKCASYGGSGTKFDWSLLNRYQLNVPFLLSGGIGINDAEACKQITHPMFVGVDLNSQFEIAPAIKDIDALKAFFSRL
ncbi:MAG: phosphoribosylanthranilate isomerase [Paludibacteraceae bacterium]|nr:phosphoribosylanthranilate isomerase [Paludibacteraceae bacterium]